MSRPIRKRREIDDNIIPPFVGIYQRGCLLGETEIGLMYSGLNTTTKQLVCLIHCQNPDYFTSEDQLRKTVDYLFDKKLEHIVQYKDVVEVEGGYLFIVIDYYGLGQLSDYTQRFILFPEHIVQILTMQYLRMLESLNNAHVVYNKLSLVNSFINNKGLLGCIGLQSPQLRINQSKSPRRMRNVNRYSLVNASSMVKDAWNLGIALIELLTGRMILESENLNAQTIIETTEFPPDISIDCINFITNCLVDVPSGNVTIEQLRNHDWMETVQELNTELLSYLIEFLESNVPYTNHNIQPETFKEGCLFVDMCPSMKLITDNEIKDYEMLKDVSVVSILITKLKEDLNISNEHSEEAKKQILALLEEMEKEIGRYNDDIYSFNPNQISFDQTLKELENQIQTMYSMTESYCDIKEQDKMLINEIERIEHFINKNSKNGVILLAESLFGKLSPRTIHGERYGVLDYLCIKDEKKEKAITDKNWKSCWAVMKSNFMILFKTQDDPTILDAFLFTPGKYMHINNEKYNRKICFSIDGHIFSAEQERFEEDWKIAVQLAIPWFDDIKND